MEKISKKLANDIEKQIDTYINNKISKFNKEISKVMDEFNVKLMSVKNQVSNEVDKAIEKMDESTSSFSDEIEAMKTIKLSLTEIEELTIKNKRFMKKYNK